MDLTGEEDDDDEESVFVMYQQAWGLIGVSNDVEQGHAEAFRPQDHH